MNLILVLVGMAHLQRACQEAVLAKREPDLLRLVVPWRPFQVLEGEVANDPGVLRVCPLACQEADQLYGVYLPGDQPLADLSLVRLPQVPVHDRAHGRLGHPGLRDRNEQFPVRGITGSDARAVLDPAVGLIAERGREGHAEQRAVKPFLIFVVAEKTRPEKA